MKVITVKTKRQMKLFINLPYKLYGQHPCYVPPLWIDEKKAYSGKNNPILESAPFTLLLVVDENNKAIGRLITYIDKTHNNYYKVNIGFFGAFDCENNKKAADLLISHAEKWVLSQGMDCIRGPINPVAEYWGFVKEGYDSSPVFMSPWNPEYYHDFFVKRDYKKAKDLLVYEADMDKGYTLPKRYKEFPKRLLKRYDELSIRKIDMKNIKRDAKSIWELTNLALADNWGYVPLELPVMEDMFKKLKLIVDENAVWFIEANKKVVGYCLGFPDINIILKKINGKLFPFGWYHLLFNTKKLRDYRLFGLAVHPDWHGKGLDALMYINLYNSLREKNIRMEANYILEDNLNIKNALLKLGMKQIKTYRIYDKKL